MFNKRQMHLIQPYITHISSFIKCSTNACVVIMNSVGVTARHNVALLISINNPHSETQSSFFSLYSLGAIVSSWFVLYCQYVAIKRLRKQTIFIELSTTKYAYEEHYQKNKTPIAAYERSLLEWFYTEITESSWYVEYIPQYILSMKQISTVSQKMVYSLCHRLGPSQRLNNVIFYSIRTLRCVFDGSPGNG